MSTKNLPPIRSKKCGKAMEFVRYVFVNLFDIAPESEDAHNSARANGIEQERVSMWMDLIEAGEYTPADGGKITPPTVMELSNNPDGYLYQMVDGHTRRQAFAQLNSTEPFLVAVIRFHDLAPYTAPEWKIIFMIECNNAKARGWMSTDRTDADMLKTMENLAQGMGKNFTPSMSTDEMQVMVEQCVDALLDVVEKTSAKFRIAARDYVLEVATANGSTDLKKLIVRRHLEPATNAYINEVCEPLGILQSNAMRRTYSVGDSLGNEYDFRAALQVVPQAIIDFSSLSTKFVIAQITKKNSAATPLSPAEVRIERLRAIQGPRVFVERIMEWGNFFSVREQREQYIATMTPMWEPQVQGDPDHAFYV
jgi:hypothetical protein